MATDSEDRDAAYDILEEWAQASVAPILSPTDLDLILERHKRATRWSATTAYGVGQLMIPPTRNGRVYRCIQPGTSTDSRSYLEFPTSGIAWGDGTSDPILLWEDCGPDFVLSYDMDASHVNVYDIISAAKECWKMKRRKTTQFIQAGDLNFQQVHEHCVAEEARFSPKTFQSRVMRA